MIIRLNIFSNTAQTQLTQAMVDKSHQKLKFGYIRKIYRSIGNQKYLGHLLGALKKNFKSSSYTLRIKSMIIMHYLLKKTLFKNERIMLFAETELNQMKKQSPDLIKGQKQKKAKHKIMIQNQQKQYIERNIIDFYILYLLKLLAHSGTYTFAKSTTQSSTPLSMGVFNEPCSSSTLHQSPSKTTSQTRPSQSPTKRLINHEQLMLNINNGFQILNLINFILQSQESFNKMGRYYIEQQEILNLFIMYLDDLTIYNDYIKKLARVVAKSIDVVKDQQAKHCFLFLTESQKSSDRLYEFYYNRYYYSKVKKLITMPTFLTIDNNDFQRIVKQIKKVDKEFVQIVKESKYSQEYKMNKTQSCITEPNSRDKSQLKKMNQTLKTQMGIRHLDKINRTIENLRRPSKSNTKEQAQQNITKYIETFEDIYQDQNQFI